MNFQREAVNDVLDELIPLLIKHYEETGWEQDKLPLDIDFKRYLQLEDAECYVIYTVRDEDVLIGYSGYFYHTNLHHKAIVFAINDMVFVRQEHRQTPIAEHLIVYSEEQLRALGAQVVTYQVKTHLDWSSLLERNGYEYTQKFLQKWIGD